MSKESSSKKVRKISSPPVAKKTRKVALKAGVKKKVIKKSAVPLPPELPQGASTAKANAKIKKVDNKREKWKGPSKENAAKETKESKDKEKDKAKGKVTSRAKGGAIADDDAPLEKGQYDLVIVESPTKAKTIKKYLGRGFQVIASNGHIKDLPKSKLGVDIKDNFLPQIVPISGKKAILDKIQKYTSKARKIYLGPDPDREGEAIAFHLAEEINRPQQIYRVLFNAVTKPAVLDAIAHPARLDQKKYDSQRARRVLDRLVGYKISPILWEKVQRGLSAGRVQSVALRLMVEKEQDIVAFTPEQWFSIHSLFGKSGKNFEAKYYGESKDKKADLIEVGAVEKIVKDTLGKPFTVVEIKKREMRQRPTPPFTTSKLQQEAANKLGFSAKKTMMVAQKLYEGVEISGLGATGLITYMRTDSFRTEPQAIEDVRALILKKYGKDYLPPEPLVYKKKKGMSKVQDAHEAIRPTNLELAPSEVKNDLAPEEFKLYELVWNKFISSQINPSVIDQTSVTLEGNGHHFFRTTGSIIKFPGFRAVYLESAAEKSSRRGGDEENGSEDGEGEENEERNSMATLLPEMVEGEKLTPQKGPYSEEHWTTPPPRYNDASIVKELEEKGIGRPSTYASIISNIVDKGYVEKIENRYMPTQLGIVVCKMLTESFPNVMDVAFTAKVEELLDLIEEGEVKWTNVLKDFWVPFEKSLEIAKEEMKNLKKTEIPTGVHCNKCATGMYLIKWGKNGQFFACSNYPTCTSTEDFRKNLDGTYQIIPKEFTKDPCPACGKRLIVKKGRYGRFLACEEYPHCKTALPYTIDVKCPACNVGKFAEKKSRYGKFFYGCSNYPACKNAMWNLPIPQECPSCAHPVMGKKVSKKKGTYLQCPKCNATKSLEEDAAEMEKTSDRPSGHLPYAKISM